jgi:hypothetical protein
MAMFFLTRRRVRPFEAAALRGGAISEPLPKCEHASALT